MHCEMTRLQLVTTCFLRPFTLSTRRVSQRMGREALQLAASCPRLFVLPRKERPGTKSTALHVRLAPTEQRTGRDPQTDSRVVRTGSQFTVPVVMTLASQALRIPPSSGGLAPPVCQP